MYQAQNKPNTPHNPIRGKLSIPVLYDHPIIHEQENTYNNRHKGGRIITFCHIWLDDTFRSLQFVRILYTFLYSICVADQRHDFITMGLSLYHAHYVVSDALGQGVEWGMFGEVEGLFLFVGIVDLYMDDTFLQVFKHWTTVYLFALFIFEFEVTSIKPASVIG